MSEMAGGVVGWVEEHFTIPFLMSLVEAVTTSENNFLIKQNCATVWCSFSSCCVGLK